MRDIPLFTTEYGVASLSLGEITHKKEAYIRIQSACEPDALLQEAISFCRAAGAETIYATGHDSLAQYPLHTTIVRMSCEKCNLPLANEVSLIPVTDKTLETWREMYNDRMQTVPNCATMTIIKAKEMLNNGSAYFVCRGGAYLGIGAVSGCCVDAVASIVKGAGETVLLALAEKISGELVCVEVAANNLQAMRLYSRLGFSIDEKISDWFRVL